MKTTRGFSGIIILIAIAVIVGGAFWYAQQKKEVRSMDQENSASPSPQTQMDEFTSWKTYSSPTGLFSFKYPSDWKVVSETQSMPPLIAVSPSGYDNSRNFGAFQVYKIIDDGSSNDMQGKSDTGWRDSAGYVDRLITTRDEKYRIVLAGDDKTLQATNEKILSTFEYQP